MEQRPGNAKQICGDDKVTSCVGTWTDPTSKARVVTAAQGSHSPRASRCSTAGAIAATKLATAPVVGWSNNNVCGNSASTRCARVVASAVAAIESRPADIRGVSAASEVPAVSKTTAETVSIMSGAPCVISRGRFASALGACASSVSRAGAALGDASSSTIQGEAAMERSDGWSKRSVCGSSVSRRELIRVDSSVAPIESRPAAIRAASAAMAVPNTSEARLASCWTRSPRAQDCARDATVRAFLTRIAVALLDRGVRWVDGFVPFIKRGAGTVSYTHLTLPTTAIV